MKPPSLMLTCGSQAHSVGVEEESQRVFVLTAGTRGWSCNQFMFSLTKQLAHFFAYLLQLCVRGLPKP